MFRSIVIASVLFAAALGARIEDYENLIEYDIPITVRRGILPYPLKESQEDRIVAPGYYNDVVLPSIPALPVSVGLTKLGVVAKVAAYAFSVAKAAFVFIISHGPALIVGSLAALGLCKFTPVCSKLSGVKSLLEAQHEFRSYATPERIARAAQFVQTAIDKYSHMQKNY